MGRRKAASTLHDWRKLAGSRRGNVTVMTALVMPALFGAAGFASDTAIWVMMHNSLQRQADSAALAGVHALTQRANVVASVNRDLARNQRFGLSAAPLIENAPTVGPEAGNSNAVRVRVTTSLRLPFSAVMLRAPVTISAEATAAVVQNSDYCLLALDSGNGTGISNGGNADVELGCGMHSNTGGANAVSATGSARVAANPVSAVGSIDTTSANFVSGTRFRPNSMAMADPYAALPLPAISAATTSIDVKPNETRTLSPGTYADIDVKGTATFQPGIYFIDGRSGSLKFGAQARASGTGVTFVLTMSTPPSSGTSNSIAGLTINGGAELDFTAPATGPYRGVIIYQDRRATLLGQTIRINGNASGTLEGALYFPSNEVRFNGASGMSTACLQIVARRLVFTGNTRITNNCPPAGGATAFRGGNLVRLVA